MTAAALRHEQQRLRRTEAPVEAPRFTSTALYAAQATEILLDAIARSDGTRSSLTRELRRTSVEDGILGAIRFDENGDLVEAPVTIFASSASDSATHPSHPSFEVRSSTVRSRRVQISFADRRPGARMTRTTTRTGRTRPRRLRQDHLGA